MTIKKIVNRNPFTEKLIHRYVLESLYFDRNQVNHLLPLWCRKKKVNVIIPESKSDGRYTPDFKIYFQGRTAPLLLEIKWSADSLKRGSSQANALSKARGCVWSIRKRTTKTLKSIHFAQLDSAQIMSWLRTRVSPLWADALRENDAVSTNGSEATLLLIRGAGAIKHWHAMTKMVSSRRTNRNHHFWAFQTWPETMRRILSLTPNSKLIILLMKAGGGYQKLPSYSKIREYSVELLEAQITVPYYIFDGTDSQARVFENAKSRDLSRRKWVHFIDFKITKKSQGVVNVSPRASDPIATHWPELAKSYNRGGTGVTLISASEVEQLLDIYR